MGRRLPLPLKYRRMVWVARKRKGNSYILVGKYEGKTPFVRAGRGRENNIRAC